MIFAALVLSACASEPTVAAPPAEVVAAPAPPPPPPPPPKRVTLAAVGDVLPHRTVRQAAAARGWAWTFEDVAPVLQAADLTFGNLEAPIAPSSHDAGWEIFNAPADLADGLAGAGFDVVSTSNNHAWDQGADGILETLAQLDRVGVAHAGSGSTCDVARAPAIVERDGVRIAFLAVADLTNHGPWAPPGDPAGPCVFFAGDVCEGADCGPDRDALHFRPDPERLLAAVRAARAQADFVVLSFHWGNEFRNTPLPEYPPLARTLVEGGVDVLLGHHPHVLQPIERVRRADGTEGLVAYSLGNFVSNMGATYGLSASSKGGATRDGGVLRVELVVEPDGRRHLGVVDFVPTWTVNDSASPGLVGAPSVRPVRVDGLPAEQAAGRRASVGAVIGEGWLAPPPASPEGSE